MKISSHYCWVDEKILCRYNNKRKLTQNASFFNWIEHLLRPLQFTAIHKSRKYKVNRLFGLRSPQSTRSLVSWRTQKPRWNASEMGSVFHFRPPTLLSSNVAAFLRQGVQSHTPSNNTPLNCTKDSRIDYVRAFIYVFIRVVLFIGLFSTANLFHINFCPWIYVWVFEWVFFSYLPSNK